MKRKATWRRRPAFINSIGMPLRGVALVLAALLICITARATGAESAVATRSYGSGKVTQCGMMYLVNNGYSTNDLYSNANAAQLLKNILSYTSGKTSGNLALVALSSTARTNFASIAASAGWTVTTYSGTSSLTSLSAISAFDLVVVGTDGYGLSDNNDANFNTNIQTYVSNGGGLLVTGWVVYTQGYNSNFAAMLQAIGPFSSYTTNNAFKYGYSLVYQVPSHPILNGVGPINISSGEFGEYPDNAVLASGATSVATYTSSNLTGGGNSISTGTISSPLCTGPGLSVPYTATGTFNTGNVFTAELSDASGSFSSPVAIGTVSSTSSGTINATIPASTPPGTGYLIRVSSNNPVTTGSNSSSLTINGPVRNTSTTPVSYYCTIQAAINAASSGDVIRVDAGTYAEDITVNKSVSILGPNDNINPCSGSRVAEAVVVPSGTGSVPSGATAVETGEIFHVAASNVTIKGFTIDGDNTSVTSGVTNTTGADMNAAEGVTIYENNINNLTVSNNIFRNLSYTGVTIFGASYSAPATSGHTISNNKMENLGTYNDPSSNTTFNINKWGNGVLLYNSQYADISNNCMDNVRNGIQTGNFHLANPGTTAYQNIAGNTMTNVRRSGIFHNLLNALASGYTISGNSITGTSNLNETKWDGIDLFSLNSPCTVSNNTINATSVSQTSYGYDVWNVASTNPSAINGGTVTGADIGVFVNNYDGYGSDAHPDGAHASLASISITPKTTGAGIRVYDNPASSHDNVQLSLGTGVLLNNGTDGLVIENASAAVTALSNVAFSGQSGSYIKLINNANNLDATSATFGGVAAGSTLTPAQGFAIEDKIVHKIDNSALGFVTVKANNDYVTTSSFVSPNTTADIQRGIDAASTGYTVNVAAGTYTNNPNVNKSIILSGAQAGVCAATRSGSGESVISCANGIGVNASGATINGFTIQGQTSQSAPGFGYAVYMATTSHGTQLLNNIIQNNVIGSSLSNTGTNPAQVLVNCNWFKTNNNSGPSGGNGIYTDGYTSGGAMSNVIVSNNKFSGNANAGIIMDMVDATRAGSNISISTNEFSGNAIAMFVDFMNNSSFTSNVVSGSTYGAGADVYLYGGVNSFSIANNFFSRSATGPEGIYISNDGGANNSSIGIHSNSFIGYSSTAKAIDLASGYTGPLSATCNWFNSTVPATVAAQISGNVTYVPYLSSGTDADANPANGFQPAASCSGTCPNVTATAAVSPTYPMPGQKIQTIYFGYPASAQSETINITPAGGAGPYSYVWTMSACSSSTPAPLNNTTSSYTFTPASMPNNGQCNPAGSDNIYTYTIKVSDGQGCGATLLTKRLNVINPYVGDSVLVCHKVIVGRGYAYQIIKTSKSIAANYVAQGDQLGNCNAFTGRLTAPGSGEEEQAVTSGAEVMVYPNPSTGAFNVALSAIENEAEVIVTDMQGKLIAHQTITKDAPQAKASFDLSSVARGVYLVQVKDGSLNYRTKIVVQ